VALRESGCEVYLAKPAVRSVESRPAPPICRSPGGGAGFGVSLAAVALGATGAVKGKWACYSGYRVQPPLGSAGQHAPGGGWWRGEFKLLIRNPNTLAKNVIFADPVVDCALAIAH
jgi:hypothetical protein